MAKNNLYFLIATLTCCAMALENNITTDQHTLLILKHHITHDPTNSLATNWSTNSSVCDWIGVTCSATRPLRVISLNISKFGVEGTIPPQIGDLSSLQMLDLHYNNLSGTIPSAMFNISSLQFLYLHGNQLSGPFPSIISSLPSLQSIYLGSNRLSGELPGDVFHYLPNIRDFFLAYNLFQGNIPATLFNCKNLQYLALSFNNFNGFIPKRIGNLTQLKELYLSYNHLQGEIPQEFGDLVELETLWLQNNAFSGPLPSTIFNMSSLQDLDLSNNGLMGNLPEIGENMPFLEQLRMSNNHFTGEIPNNFGLCKSLHVIDLHANQFRGKIPNDIGNLTMLQILYLSENNLTGEIPHEISNLRSVQELAFNANNLFGEILPAIFNLSNLDRLYLQDNRFSGSLPSDLDYKLPHLQELHLWGNDLSGAIPNFITNISELSVLELQKNSFSGSVPDNFGDLRNLKVLKLNNNKLTTTDLSFLASMANCKNLQMLQLGENPFHGRLPHSIRNLSTSIQRFSVEACGIVGHIPEEFGNLSELVMLDLEDNQLTGHIPATIGKLKNLQALYLDYNKLEGRIPDEICQLSKLSDLDLRDNKLSGSLPACLGHVTALRGLWLSSNKLSSTIPLTLWNLKDILYLNLSSNSLDGPLSGNIGNLKEAVEIDLSGNKFLSHIPSSIVGLQNLQSLYLNFCRLHGTVPESFGNLVSLKYLDLSSNNISGIIPKSLDKLIYLEYLNLSFNELQGEVPKIGRVGNLTIESFMGNQALCGGLSQLHLPPCRTNHRRESKSKTILVLEIALPAVAGITLLVLALVFICRKGRESKRMLPVQSTMSLETTWRRISYHELQRATNGFSENNLLGTGGFGSVYRGTLSDGIEVAVKVFHSHLEGVTTKSFEVECEVLRGIRHRNLVKVISSCSNPDFKALVLDYMPNGSLDKCLYSKHCSLDMLQRLNIMVDVASALEYLHFGNSTSIVHCDLKPSNVLLDHDMVARLSDFGTVKLLTGEDSMTQTQTLATLGYMAPEYGREGKVSRECDVYSFGIMLLETFTKKKPTEDVFVGDMSLRRWVSDSLSGSYMEVVDSDLLRDDDEDWTVKQRCMLSILSLAVDCTAELPQERSNINNILKMLIKIRQVYVAKSG